MHRCATRQADRRRPQRVIGRRQQHFVAIIEQAVGGHDNQLAGAIAQVNVVQRHAFDALLLRLVHHRFARGKNAFAVGVTGRIGQVTDHILLNFFRRVKAKDCQIANIELDDFLPLLLHLARAVHDGPPDVVTHVRQFG